MICPIAKNVCWESCAWRVGKQCAVAAIAEALSALSDTEQEKTSAAFAYTVMDVAEYMNVTRQTVSQWIRDGKLRGTKVGRDYRVTKRDLDAFILKGEQSC